MSRERTLGDFATLSDMRTADRDEIAAVACGDLHVGTRRPPARRDKDWIATLRNAFLQVRTIAKGVPILYPGDLLEWDATPEDINAAIQLIPRGYAVPGNHDLPDHDQTQLYRSAYQTLVEAGTVVNLKPGEATRIRNDVYVYGWPDRTGPIAYRQPVPKSSPEVLHVALIHDYVWDRGHCHPGAKPQEHAEFVAPKLRALGYGVAVFGDNHAGFTRRYPGFVLTNPGCVVRRRSDERSYQPAVSVIWRNGNVTTVPLDVSADVFVEVPEGTDPAVMDVDVDEYVNDLQNLGDVAVNFREAVRRFARHNVGDPLVIKMLISYLQKAKGADRG